MTSLNSIDSRNDHFRDFDHTGKPNKTVLLIVLTALLWCAVAPIEEAKAQQGPFNFNNPPLQGNDQWSGRATQAAMEMLEKTCLRQGNKWYVQFTVTPGNPPQPRGGGFADIVPFQSEPPAASGLMEIVASNPNTYPNLIRPGVDWSGNVSMRLTQYRLFRPDRGWSEPKQLLIHFWEWSGQVRNGIFSLVSKTDAQYGTTDGGPTEFVASVFNVLPSRVTCIKPLPMQVPGLVPPVVPDQELNPFPAPVKPNFDLRGFGGMVPAADFLARSQFQEDLSGTQRALKVSFSYNGAEPLQDVDVTVHVTLTEHDKQKNPAAPPPLSERRFWPRWQPGEVKDVDFTFSNPTLTPFNKTAVIQRDLTGTAVLNSAKVNINATWRDEE